MWKVCWCQSKSVHQSEEESGWCATVLESKSTSLPMRKDCRRKKMVFCVLPFRKPKALSLLTRSNCWRRLGCATVDLAANREKIRDVGPPLQLLMKLFCRREEENRADQVTKRKTKGKVLKNFLSSGIIGHRRWLVDRASDSWWATSDEVSGLDIHCCGCPMDYPSEGLEDPIANTIEVSCSDFQRTAEEASCSDFQWTVEKLVVWNAKTSDW